MGRTFVGSKAEFPKEPHLAIIEFRHISIPGDERSRTNPGHGYPEHTETTIQYIAYPLEDRDEWEADIRQRLERAYSNEFLALDCGRYVTVKLEAKLTID